MPPVRNDTSLTLDDLILRVAEASGIADYSGDVAAVPTSTHDYDLCRRAVNDGIEMVYRASPNWSFLEQEVTWTMNTAGTGPLNVSQDPARYTLPWYVSGPPIGADLLAQGSGNTVYRPRVVNMALVREARASAGSVGTGGSTSGAPVMVGFERLPATDGGRSLWQAVIFPDPDYAYTLRATFRCFAPKLVGRGDRHVMGAEHDQTVIAAAIYAKKLTDSKDAIERENYRQAFDRAVGESIRLDEQTVPRTLCVYDPSVDSRGYEHDIGDRTGMAITLGTP